MTIQLIHGDCLDVDWPQVDAIITDVPYGVTACKWDSIIPFPEMWAKIKGSLKPRGAFVTTASQPFTSALVMSNPSMFKEEIIWNKIIPSGMNYARFMHMRQHENILVFADGRMIYNPQVTEREFPIKKGGNKYSETAPIAACKTGAIYKKIYTTKQPTTIVSYDKIRRDSQHPTQKPVALYEYLIKTYTNEGDTVLDFCAGSGTTLQACINTGRNGIGIEKDEKYYNIARQRLGL